MFEKALMWIGVKVARGAICVNRSLINYMRKDAARMRVQDRQGDAACVDDAADALEKTTRWGETELAQC